MIIPKPLEQPQFVSDMVKDVKSFWPSAAMLGVAALPEAPQSCCPPDAVALSAVEAKPTNPKDAIAGAKVPLWLLSPIAKAHWASAQFCGQVKYGAWNWRDAGARASVYISAMGRHIDAYTSGETHDPIDGTHHLGNIMACCAILLEATEMEKLVDDRPPSFSVRSTYKEVEGQMAQMRVLYKDWPTPRHFDIRDTKS